MEEDSESSPTTQHLLHPTTTTTTTTTTPKKLTLIPLIFLIYFEVSGGPYGEEPTVGAAGPLLALLGFLIFPFIWSIPEALITAELSTTFPGNGGYVRWAHRAFGPFWGSLMGSFKFLCGVINLASYPLLCIDYLKALLPIFSSTISSQITVISLSLILSFLNYTGLSIVGYTSVVLGILSISPFIVLTVCSVPKIDPSRWISLGEKGVAKDWTLYFNTLFWNLNFWDSVSTLAGEVDEPQKTFPKALFFAGIFICLGYLIPLLASTGAISLVQEDWVEGYFAVIAEMIAGKWLKIWVEIGAVLSVMGLYEAQLSSCAYQFLGMAELGVLPTFCGARSRWFGTPWVGILVSLLMSLSLLYMDINDVISSANFLYSLGMLLEFASFLRLRWKFSAMKRPFRVPLGMPGLVVLCLVPSVFLVVVMVLATELVLLVSGFLTLVGILWYFFMQFCKSKRWLEFNFVEYDDSLE